MSRKKNVKPKRKISHTVLGPPPLETIPIGALSGRRGEEGGGQLTFILSFIAPLKVKHIHNVITH